MNTISVKIENANAIKRMFDRAPAIATAEISGAVKDATFEISRQTKLEVPVDTGKLRQHIEVSIHPMSGTITPLQKYALTVHEGTKPHTILPKNKPFLAFKSKGKWIYAKKVRHPGTKANPFMDRAVDNSRETINKIFETALGNIVTKMAAA